MFKQGAGFNSINNSEIEALKTNIKRFNSIKVMVPQTIIN